MTGTGQGSPLVSVVVPAYNAEHFIRRSVDSVLAQSYSRCEVIVVDDGSTDQTLDVLAPYRDRLRVISQSNAGVSAARNAGIAVAAGEFVAFLDPDDYWASTKIERQVEMMQRHPDVGFCSTEARVEDAGGNTLGFWRCPEAACTVRTIFGINAAIPGSGSGVLARKELLDKLDGFDVTLTGLEDIDLWLRMASCSSYKCIPEPLTIVYRRKGSLSDDLDMMRGHAMTVMRKNRNLLASADRGSFWRFSYAGVLADYSKWEYRSGRRGRAIWHLLQGMMLSPLGRGRMIAGLLWAAIRGAPL